MTAIKKTTLGPGAKRALGLAVALQLAGFSTGCVRPEQRAVLADPKMRFEGDPRAARQLEHAVENREGSFGGGSVQGGGCGCN